MTFLAPPSMWALAFEASVKKPVDSMTMSAPTPFQSRLAGSRSAKTLKDLPSTEIESSSKVTSPSRRPRTESYLSSVASVLLSVRSFTATISMSAPEAIAAR